MGWILRYIEKMRARPTMYISGDSTKNFRSFMIGYMCACEDLGFPQFDEDDAVFLEYFTYWLAIKFDTDETQSWYGLIDTYYGEFLDTPIDNSMEAFYIFFDEYTNLLNTVSFQQIQEDYDKFLEKKKEERMHKHS